MPVIEGSTDPRFAKVRDAFASGFADGLETGGALAVVADGRLVVDLWGGHADPAGAQAWRPDTLVNVWSVTKGMMALAIAMLVERGKLAYEAPIANVWPEFAANGKGAITLDLVLSHRAGLNGLRTPITLEQLCQWKPYADALAAMEPLYSPGSVCAYHALSYGHLTGESLRRVDGRTPGRFVVDEIAKPLDAPFLIGLPLSEESKVAVLIEGPGCNDWLNEVRSSPHPEAVDNPPLRATDPNKRIWRESEIPGGNGHSNARALARVFGVLALGGGKLISRQALASATRQRFDGMDASFNLPTTWAAGFRLGDPDFGSSSSKAAFGHGGWGGSIAFADPESGLGFAYVTNRMLGFDAVDPRRERTSTAVYEALRN
jgi:CubicO group peptidase (beta-lactamase class C family)